MSRAPRAANRSAARRGLGVVLCVMIAGCGGGSSRSVPRPALRGVAVRAFRCPPSHRPGTRRVEAIRDARELLFCPWSTRGPGAHTILLRRTSSRFDVIVAALSAPDAEPRKRPCPTVHQVPVLVLAETGRGPFQLSIPLGACHGYQRRVAKLIFSVYVAGARR